MEKQHDSFTHNYKQYHEAFMQNHNGTTSLEIFSLILPAFFEIFIATTVASYILTSHISTSSVKEAVIHFIIDFTAIIIPIICGITIFADFKLYFLLGLSVITVLIAITIKTYSIQRRNTPFVKPTSKNDRRIINNRRHFITNARASITAITIVAILAVDFQIFPRRYAKTETFGYSLMDVGVGLFVFSNGLVTPELSRKPQSLIKSIISSVPLWLLGAGRFLIVREIDYQVHVSEYGVHWNFFITLAVTKILCSLLLNLISVNYSLSIAVIVLAIHEYLLQNGLSDFVLQNLPRNTFVLANREGIVSSFGYVGLYFLSVHFGKLVYQSKSSRSDSQLGLLLFLWSIILLVCVLLCENYFGISRRLASAGYCFWIMFLGILMCFLLLIGENFSGYLYLMTNQRKRVYVPLIYEAISFNGLACFLLANILTGLINVCMQTLRVDAERSLLILIGYMFVNCFVISVLYMRNIKLKLW